MSSEFDQKRVANSKTIKAIMYQHGLDRDQAREFVGLPSRRRKKRNLNNTKYTMPQVCPQKAVVKRMPCGHVVITETCQECECEANKKLKLRVK